MDQTQLQQKIAEYYEKLPKIAQTVFSSMLWMEDLKKIIAKYSLNEVQEQSLGTETMLVLLGIISEEEYEMTVRTDLAVEEDMATKIITDVNDMIIATIRPELAEVYKKNNIVEESTIDMTGAEGKEETKQAINSVDWKQAVIDIKTKYNFNLIQLEDLETEMQAVFSGTAKPENFQNEIKTKMDITDAQAQEVANEVNEKVFKKIRTNLVQIVAKENAPDTELQEEDSVLKDAGIELIKENAVKINIAENDASKEKREDMIKDVEKPELILPVEKKEERVKLAPDFLGAKLAGNFKLNPERTEYSIGNMTKDVEKKLPEMAVPREEKTHFPKVDPYRELPE